MLSVGLLFGGESAEHEVSIVSARSIAQNLDSGAFRVIPIGIARNGVWVVLGDPFARLAAGELPKKGDCAFLPLEAGAEKTSAPDVIFNVIHGSGGEDGQIQGYLEILKIPYTGAGRLCNALAMDKWMTKRVWESEGLPVTPYKAISEEDWKPNPKGFIDECLTLGLPVFVKPANSGSSIGIEKIKRADDLKAAIDKAFHYDRRVLVERGLDAREIEVAVLGTLAEPYLQLGTLAEPYPQLGTLAMPYPQLGTLACPQIGGYSPIVSMPGEVLVAGEFYDFADKYLDGKSRTRIPADLPDEMAQAIRKMALQAFSGIDGYGLARVDFFVERITNNIYLNEINTIPGFTSISMFPKLMEAAGVPYKDQLAMLIRLALERHRQMADKQLGFKSGSEWYKGRS